MPTIASLKHLKVSKYVNDLYSANILKRIREVQGWDYKTSHSFVPYSKIMAKNCDITSLYKTAFSLSVNAQRYPSHIGQDKTRIPRL